MNRERIVAKKKKSKPSSAPTKPQTEGARYIGQMQMLLEAGSHAGVKKLAASAPTLTDDEQQEVARIHDLLVFDPVQVAVGVGAFIAVLIAVMLTLQSP